MGNWLLPVKKHYWVFLRKLKTIKYYTAAALCHWLPLQKKVVFLNYSGKGYGCNCKYIAEELIARKLPYKLVWPTRNMETAMPEEIHKVPFESLRAIYELATAKVIVANTKVDMRIWKKKGQYVIQTWHTSFSPKLFEGEATALPADYIRQSIRNSKQTDLFLSNCRNLSRQYRKYFWCNCEILECGFPRNDILFHWDPSVPAKVKKELGIPEDGRILLYAPTFRDDMSTDAFNIDTRAVLEALNSTGGDWYVILRHHPNVRHLQNMFSYDDHVLNGTNYPDMQLLLLASDILITDYSSTFYEFAVLKKPTYIYAPDVDAYKKMRGLNADFFRMPFPVSRTNEELAALLRTYSPEAGEKDAAKFMEFFGGVDRGDASQRVANRIEEVMEDKPFSEKGETP